MGSGYYGSVIGYSRSDSIRDCYYLSGQDSVSDSYAESKTADQFASGEVAYLLNDSTSSGELNWYQTIGTDPYPNFNSEGSKAVYYSYADCSATEKSYSNSEGSDTQGNHDFSDQPYVADEDGIHHNQKCKNCDFVNQGNHDFYEQGGSINTSKQKCSLCNAKNIAYTGLSIAATPSSYTGAEQTATITGIDSANYDVVENSNKATTVGTHTIKITGKGEYAGTREISWTISKAAPTATVPTGLTAKYGQTLADISLTNPDGNTAGTWSWVSPTTLVGSVGSHTFKANFTPTDSANYNAKTNVDVTVTVEKADAVITADNVAKTYGDPAFKLSVTKNSTGAVTYSSSATDVATVAADGTVTIKKNGTATITIGVATDANYAAGTKDITLTVNQSSNPPYKPAATMSANASATTVADVALGEGWTWSNGAALLEGDSVNATANYTASDADCYTTGSKSVAITITKAAHNHIAGDLIVDTAATCTANGVGHKNCTVEGCNETLESNIPIISNGHEWNTNFTTDVEATTTSVGSKSRHCKNCSEKTDITEIPKLTPGGGSGGGAGGGAGGGGGATPDPEEPETPEEPEEPTTPPTVAPSVAPTVAPTAGTEVADTNTGAKVEIADPANKEVTYTAPITEDAKVTVPDVVVIGGVEYKVTKIDEGAFENNKTLTSVTIGSNVTVIGENAFKGCTNLKTVTLPKAVATIGDGAFKGCSSLTKVTIPSKVKEIGANAFDGCKNLKKVALPSKVTKIGAKAFNGCKNLNTITISSTKLTSKSVSKNAFKGVSKNTVIKVPKSKVTAYKKLFAKKGLSSKVKVKAK